MGVLLRVRIAASGQVVIGDGHQHQQHGIGQHRHQHEFKACRLHRRAADHRGQRHRAAGRMQAARQEHGGNITDCP